MSSPCCFLLLMALDLQNLEKNFREGSGLLPIFLRHARIVSSENLRANCGMKKTRKMKPTFFGGFFVIPGIPRFFKEKKLCDLRDSSKEIPALSLSGHVSAEPFWDDRSSGKREKKTTQERRQSRAFESTRAKVVRRAFFSEENIPRDIAMRQYRFDID